MRMLFVSLFLAGCLGSTSKDTGSTHDTDDTDDTHDTDDTDDTDADISCATAADCEGDLVCKGPNDWPGCGIAPLEDCGSDTDCGGGTRCHAVSDGCSADGIGSECGDACEPDGCVAGFSCEEGSCRAISCVDDPTVCAAWQVCDPDSVLPTAPVYDLHHGCVEVACTDDGGCSTGMYCVNTFCQEAPGECAELETVA